MAIASKKSKVLITGAEGFTGRYLVQEMSAAGYEVFGTTHHDIDLRNPTDVQSVVHDIKPDLVAHLAAISSVTENDIARIYETNVLGSLYLLQALAELKDHPPRSILFASSANIYGNSASGAVSETQTPAPTNDYAVSKYAMEQMAKLWVDRLPLFMVRPFNYTGIGQNENFLIPKIVNHFKTKKATIELGNLDVWREFNDVRFVAKIYQKLLDMSPTGQIINICTGTVYSLREVIALCEEITGHHIQVQVNPAFVRNNEVHTLYGDNTRLKDLIGDYQNPSLKETLTWMLNDAGVH